MKSVKKIWDETAQKLNGIYDQDEARRLVRLLLEDAFGVDRTAIFTDEHITLDEMRLDGFVSRLLAHEPIQYVTGVADFYGRKFKVAPGALIPRPETEELVRLVVEENDQENPRILDVGVGSGCIAITLALEMRCSAFGTDISQQALSIARDNAQTLEASVQFTQSDVLNSNPGEKDLDILVSNPPYIPEIERSVMSRNVTDYEPEEALFVPDGDPLVFYRRIAEAGLVCLKVGGRLYFEINENFGEATVQLLKRLGYGEIVLHKDMQGKDRVIRATNSASK